MRLVKKFLSILITFSIVLPLITFPTFAVASPYETAKDNVPIWSQSNSSSTKVRTEKRQGTILNVVSSSTNSHGNLWYMLEDGNWVFSGNVRKHSHVAVSCSMPQNSYEGKSATEHYRVTKYDDLCACGAVVKKDITTKTAEKHTFSNGNCSICGYTCQHDYTGGICNTCKYEWPYHVETINQTPFIISNDDGAKIWSRPYSKQSTHLRTEEKGTDLTAVGKTTNEAGNLWYMLSDGNWVFSGNITQNTHTHKAVSSSLDVTLSYQQSNDREHYRISTYDELCSCGATVKKNVTSKVTEKHSFSATRCTKCGYTQPAETSYTITYHANGGVGAPAAHGHIQNTTSILSNVTPMREGYIFLGWATDKNATGISYNAGSKYDKNANITLYAVWKSCIHKYTSSSGDACILCGQFFEPTLTKIDAPMYAVKDNVPVRNAPYSDSGYVVNELEKGAQVHIAYSLENALGHLWYRTNDGSYVFADNLSSTKIHTHKAVKTTKATKTYTPLNSTYHLITETTDATLCSCGKTIQGGTVKTYTERHKSIRGGNCSLCSGSSTAGEAAISPTLYSTQSTVSVYKDLKTGSVIQELKPGTLVTIVATQNVSDHTRDPIVLWGKTVNGTWIPLERELTGALAKKSSISLPPKGIYEVTAASAPLRELPTSSATIKEKLTPGQRVQITNTYYNDVGNQWGTTADGYEVYLGNLRYTGTDAQVIINGTILKPSSPLLNENGRLLVPVRDIAAALGAHIHWDQDSQTVLIQRDLDSVILQIGNNKIYSEEIKSIDVGAKLVNNRTYVPLRALSEMFDAEVGWIDGTKTATVDCPIPSTESVNKSIIDDFKQWEFYSFNFYKTFAAEHSGSAAPLHVIGNIGEFGVKITAGVFKDVFEALIYNKYDEVHPLDDYSINQIKTSMKAIISAIPELERHVALNAAFSGQYDNVDNVKDLAEFVEEGGNFLHDEFKFKTKGMASFCKQAGRVLDLTKFSTESLEYIFTEYQHQLIYLDILEQACANSPYAAMAVDELREEYENKVLGTLKHSQDKLLESAADELLGKIPLYDLATILVEGVFDLSGVNETTQNTLNAASNYIITANLVRYYSMLTKDCFDLSSGNLKSTVSQAAWDRVSTAFTLTKTAVRLNYQSMHDAAHNSATQAYLKAQLDVLNRIHIQPYVSKARNAPYYYQ